MASNISTAYRNVNSLYPLVVKHDGTVVERYAVVVIRIKGEVVHHSCQNVVVINLDIMITV